MRSLVARGNATAVPVDRIAVDDIRRLVEVKFPGHGLPSALVDVVDRVTAGTPLFVAAFLDDLVDRRMVAQADDEWRLVVGLDEVAAHRPDTLRQLIDIQLDRLSLDEQRLLEAASVIGASFPISLVA